MESSNKFVLENVESITNGLLNPQENGGIIKGSSLNSIENSTKSNNNCKKQWTRIEKRMERIFLLLMSLVILAVLSATTEFLHKRLAVYKTGKTKNNTYFLRTVLSVGVLLLLLLLL